MKNKNILCSSIIAIIMLILITFGATYAYFTVGSANNFGSKALNVYTQTYGNVAISFGSNLTLDLTAKDMLDNGRDITYYASTDGKTTVDTTENVGVVTVNGEGTFTCNYKLVIDDNESSLYEAFQTMPTKSTGQIILIVNGTSYDFNTSNLFPKTISGTMTGLTSTNSQNITAQLKFVNKTGVNQNALSDKNISLTFKITEFNCLATA